jgi:molecular chaperone DnaK (HSP70)
VQFEIDADGLQRALGRDIATGLDVTVKVESAVEVSDEAVEKMLSDSLEHAFEDMDERAFAEACLKADEMLPAVETALRRLGAGVAPDERQKISELVSRVLEAKANHSLVGLKSALEALDTATETVAARLVEGVLQGEL